jgi:predicted nucleic acid-binding protein
MAPDLMLTEVANALWKIQRVGRLGATDPLDLLHDAAALVDHFEPDASLLGEAIALAERVLP